MNSLEDMKLSLVKDSQRLLDLTNTLNLEDHDKVYDGVFFEIYPFVGDFKKLKDHIYQQRKICSCYGLDNNSFDDSVFKKMQVLTCHLASHFEAAMTYCLLKSQLFLEQNDFFDEVVAKVERRMETCASEDELERLMLTVFRIRSIYDICL